MRRKKNQGQVLILVTLSLLLLLGMLGLVVDLGWAYYRQQGAQAAADAAAMAGAQAALYDSGGNITCGANNVVCQGATACSNPITSPPAQNTDNACLYAQTNGFQVSSGSNQNVMIEANITSPPPGLTGVNDLYYVRARVAEVSPLTFSAVFGSLTQLISARATAVVNGRAATCIYVLDPTDAGSFEVSGPGNTINSSCGIFVNSSSADAMIISGPSNTITASQIDIVGTDPGLLNSGSPPPSPTPTTGVSAEGNPLGYLQPPPVGACTHTPALIVTTSQALGPGVYCGGIIISGSALSISFGPGTYILEGGGLTVSGPNITLTGTGVTFYNTFSASYPYGAITISGSTITMNLSAPTTGPLQGILFFQNPAVPVGNPGSTFSGSSSSILNGVLYFPTTQVTFSGSANSGGYTSLVAYKVLISGPSSTVSDFNNNYGALANGSPFKVVALVE